MAQTHGTCPDQFSGVRETLEESLEARVPLSAIRGVEVLDDAHSWTGIGAGFKVGMRVPGVASVATVRGHGEKMFVAVHGDTPRGVRVRLEGVPGMSGSSAAPIPKPSPPPWRQRAEPPLQ